MKKIMFSMAAAILMSASALAQTDNAPQQPDQAEMIKQRTENTVKQYGLNEDLRNSVPAWKRCVSR